MSTGNCSVGCNEHAGWLALAPVALISKQDLGNSLGGGGLEGAGVLTAGR